MKYKIVLASIKFLCLDSNYLYPCFSLIKLATVAQKGHVNYRFQPFPFPIWKFLVTDFQFADLSLPISLFRVTNFQFVYFLLPN